MPPTEAELLRFIAENEPLALTRARFALSRAEVQALLGYAPAQTALSLATPPSITPGALRKARVYSDGASRGNPGLAGAGAVILDAHGQVVERLKRFLGHQTNNIAEYEGALLGLRQAQELGVRELELLADSQLLIRQLGGQYQVKNAGIRPLYEMALSLLEGFAKVKLVHVPREQNTLADEMSNRAIDER